MKKYIGFSIIALGMTLTSCNDYLDKLPDNRATLDTEEKVVTFLTSAYPTREYIIVNELMADNMDDDGENNPYTDRWIEQVYHWEDVTETNNASSQRFWEDCYGCIVTANQALAAIDEMGSNSNSMRQARAEALLCRAYNHFMLACEFCKRYDSNTADTELGIPYMTELESTLNQHHERGTLAEVYANIDKDLQEALPLIGDDNYQIPKFHFNQKAAYAFATRFYLFYEKWDKAVQYATQCLGGNPSSVLRDWSAQAGMTQNFNAISQHYISTSLNCNLLLNTSYSQIGTWLGPWTRWKRFSHHAYTASNEDVLAANVWGSGSFYMTPKVYGGSNYDFVIFWRNPYLFEYTDPVAQTGYAHSMSPVLTTDETLLNRAEAYILLKQYDKATEDLNTWMHNIVRTNTDLTQESIKDFYNSIRYSYDYWRADTVKNAAGEVVQTVDGKDSVIYVLDHIDGKVSTQKKHLHPAFDIDAEGSLQETMLQCLLGFRRIETLQMGLRWFDIKRYGIEIPRRVMNADGVPEKVTDWLTVNDERRAIQIPYDVVDAGIQPNPRVTDDDAGEMLQPIDIKQ